MLINQIRADVATGVDVGANTNILQRSFDRMNNIWRFGIWDVLKIKIGLDSFTAELCIVLSLIASN